MKGNAGLFAGGVDRHHVWMLDRGGDPRLLGKAPGEDLVGRRLGGDQLQRHAPLQARLERQVEHAHAAATQPLLYSVAGELDRPRTARFRVPRPAIAPP